VNGIIEMIEDFADDKYKSALKWRE